MNSELEADTVRFSDNQVSSGTNGIAAVNSKLSLMNLIVSSSGEPKKSEIKAEVGFLSLFEASSVDIKKSSF